MPYRNLEYRQKQTVNLFCKKCNGSINLKQTYCECDNCTEKFHLKCKNIHGENKNRVAANTTWFCSDDCQTNTIPSQYEREVVLRNSITTKEIHLNAIENPTPVMENVKISIDCLTSQLQNVLDTVINLRNMFGDLQKSQVLLAQKVDNSEKKIEKLTQENEELKKQIKDATDSRMEQCEVMKQMGYHLEYLEKSAQKDIDNNIIITGIPNTSIQPNNLINKIIQTLGATILPNQVERAKFLEVGETKPKHIPGSQAKPKHVYLQVTFTSNSSKQEILSKFRVKKQQIFVNEVGFTIEDDKRIYVREQLTQYKSNLFRKTLTFKNNHNYK